LTRGPVEARDSVAHMGLARSFEPHPDLASIRFLLGTWRGEGAGGYPTIGSFRYGEEMIFEDVGDRYLLYRQSSWTLDEGAPVHLERGFLRPGMDPRSVELTLAHPLGLAEVGEGRVNGTSMDISSEKIARTATGDAVSALLRRYRVEGDALTYEIEMAMDQTPMARHLAAELRKVPG
jgi:hypothetical protein